MHIYRKVEKYLSWMLFLPLALFVTYLATRFLFGTIIVLLLQFNTQYKTKKKNWFIFRKTKNLFYYAKMSSYRTFRYILWVQHGRHCKRYSLSRKVPTAILFGLRLMVFRTKLSLRFLFPVVLKSLPFVLLFVSLIQQRSTSTWKSKI